MTRSLRLLSGLALTLGALTSAACGNVFSSGSDGSDDGASQGGDGSDDDGSVGTGGDDSGSGGVSSEPEPEPGSGGGSGTGGAPGATLLVHLPFDAADDRFADVSPLANDFSVVGTNYSFGARDAEGGASSSLVLGAQADTYLSLPDAAELHSTEALTVAAWIHPQGLTDLSSMGIVAKREGYGQSTDFAVHLYAADPEALDEDTSRICVDIDGTESRAYSNAPIGNDQWVHVVVVFDGSAPAESRVRIYLNGEVDSVHTEQSSTIDYHATDLRIGDLPNGGGRFVGALDEVMVFPRALAEDEVAGLYEEQR